MFKKKLSLKSLVEEKALKIADTNTKNDGPSYYPETRRGREFFNAHINPIPINKTGVPDEQFTAHNKIKKVDDHGPPKVDSFAGDPHSNTEIKAVRAAIELPRVRLTKEEAMWAALKKPAVGKTVTPVPERSEPKLDELTESQFMQLDEGVRKQHYERHHNRAVAAANEIMKHLNDHTNLMRDPHYGFHDAWQMKDNANQLDDLALRIGQHVENDAERIANEKKWRDQAQTKVNSVRESVEKPKKYKSEMTVIMDILGKK